MANSIIAQLVTKKAQELITSLTPTLAQLISDIGIKNIGQPNMVIPDTCLPNDKLQQIASIRDNIYDKVNTTANVIKRLSGPVNTLNGIVIGTSAILNVVSTTKKTISAGLIPLPAAPGASVSTITTLSTLEELLKPKIATAQVSISTISLALDFANEILAKIMTIIDVIDQYLKKCANISPPSRNENLTKAINDYNQTLVPNTNNQIYKGFILEIVEEPYSPTVNRRQAVAKNNNGIILLKTPLSFTTASNILIEELKLVIDKNNLEAY